jgi:hypothetical protein
MQQDPLPNPFRKGSPGGVGPRSPVVTEKDWARLYAMGVVFMLCVGAMIYIKRTLDKPAPEGAPALPEGQVQYSIEGQPRKSPSVPQEAPLKPDAEPKKVVPLLPLPKEGELDFRALAAPFRDGSEPPVKETPEFIQLLNVMLNAVKPDAFRKLVNPAVTPDAAYHDPAKHRGEAIRSYGRLIYIYTERLETTTPNNLQYVYLGVMQEYPKNRTVYFYLPEKPADPETGKPLEFRSHLWRGQTLYDDWVEVEGVFLRNYDYPGQRATAAQAEDSLVRSVMLMAKNIRIVEKPKIKNTREGFIVVVSVIAAVLVTVVLVAGVMSRRYGGGSLRGKLLDARRQKAKQEGRNLFGRPAVPEAGKTPAEPPPPPPPAEGPPA